MKVLDQLTPYSLSLPLRSDHQRVKLPDISIILTEPTNPADNFIIISDMDAPTFRKLWDESEATLKPAVERLLKAKAKDGS